MKHLFIHLNDEQGLSVRLKIKKGNLPHHFEIILNKQVTEYIMNQEKILEHSDGPALSAVMEEKVKKCIYQYYPKGHSAHKEGSSYFRDYADY
ncbi:hypothetical protein [Chitinophaga sp. Ak27]|uniref:hypothetical protein n=1 Tax=Chitinophaga sp. Ak27 TaxID=2726116 RepID=UPI00145F8E40|nr:hypothetical protein [Chitinophaga sp. Ak27]NLU94887.1 hypothetical protein [Chitinophaga sp. Ak27]